MQPAVHQCPASCIDTFCVFSFLGYQEMTKRSNCYKYKFGWKLTRVIIIVDGDWNWLLSGHPVCSVSLDCGAVLLSGHLRTRIV